MFAGELKIAIRRNCEGINGVHSIVRQLLTKASFMMQRLSNKSYQLTADMSYEQTLNGKDKQNNEEELTIKNVNGSESTTNKMGLIVRFKNAEGRTWSFRYAGSKVVGFTDPLHRTFSEINGHWRGINKYGEKIVASPLLGVEVNHLTGQIVLSDSVQKTTYWPEGTTITQVQQVKNGQAVEIKFTEYATRPSRSFVVIEKHPDGKEFVTWIQDANGRLYQLEWHKEKLYKYIDLSADPCIIWTAEWGDHGQPSKWIGLKGESTIAEAMIPHLESVDGVGNRYFRNSDGMRFIVRPSGTAFYPKQPLDMRLSLTPHT